jgi:hypothetical protein
MQALYDEDLAGDGYIWSLSRLWAHQPETLKRLFELMSQAFTPSGLTFRQQLAGLPLLIRAHRGQHARKLPRTACWPHSNFPRSGRTRVLAMANLAAVSAATPLRIRRAVRRGRRLRALADRAATAALEPG